MNTLNTRLLTAMLTCLSLSFCQSAMAGPARGCAADRPCFNGAYQSGNQVIFQFTGVTGWDFYNVRYATVGGGERQVENRSGTFTFNNVRPNRVYTLKVQGCNSRTFGRSTCSPWVEESVTTR
jgi:Fibronectin type III domain